MQPREITSTRITKSSFSATSKPLHLYLSKSIKFSLEPSYQDPFSSVDIDIQVSIQLIMQSRRNVESYLQACPMLELTNNPRRMNVQTLHLTHPSIHQSNVFQKAKVNPPRQEEELQTLQDPCTSRSNRTLNMLWHLTKLMRSSSHLAIYLDLQKPSQARYAPVPIPNQIQSSYAYT